MTLGDKLRKLRKDAGMTQAQLADRLYVSRAAVARWENGNGTPDIIDIPEYTYLAKIMQNRILLKQLSYRPQNIMGEFFVDNKKFLDLNRNIVK